MINTPQNSSILLKDLTQSTSPTFMYFSYLFPDPVDVFNSVGFFWFVALLHVLTCTLNINPNFPVAYTIFAKLAGATLSIAVVQSFQNDSTLAHDFALFLVGNQILVHTLHYLPLIPNLVFIGPVVEEILKSFYFRSGNFGIFEFAFKLRFPATWTPINLTMSCGPIFMHYITYLIDSFWLRIVVHVIWNYTVVHYFGVIKSSLEAKILHFLSGMSASDSNYTSLHDTFESEQERIYSDDAPPVILRNSSTWTGWIADCIEPKPESFRIPRIIQIAFSQALLGMFGVKFGSQDAVKSFTFICALVRENSIEGKLFVIVRECADAMFGDAIKIAKAFCDYMMSKRPTSLVSESFLDQFDGMLDTAEEGVHSPMYAWLRTLTTGLALIPMFAASGMEFNARKFGLFDKRTAELHANEPLPFILEVCRAFSNVLKTGVTVISGKESISDTIRNSSPFGTFVTDATFLTKMQYFVSTEPTGNGTVNVHEYRTRLMAAMAQGQALVTTPLGGIPGTKPMIAKHLDALQAIESRLLAHDLASDRDPSFILVTVGPPGVGKATLTTMSQQVLSQAVGITYDTRAWANISPNSNFQDNISNGTKGIHIEELGIEVPGTTAPQKLSATKMLLYYGDSNAQLVERSDVNQKGRHVTNNIFVTANTNDVDLGVHTETRFPAAVYRRLVFQEVRVRDKFREANGFRLDQSKVGPDDQFYNVYEIRFVDMDTNSPQGFMPKGLDGKLNTTPGEWLTVDAWSQVLKSKCQAHFAKQKIRAKCVQEVNDHLCGHGSWTPICEQCAEEKGPLHSESAYDSALVYAAPVLSPFFLMWSFIQFFAGYWALLFWQISFIFIRVIVLNTPILGNLLLARGLDRMNQRAIHYFYFKLQTLTIHIVGYLRGGFTIEQIERLGRKFKAKSPGWFNFVNFVLGFMSVYVVQTALILMFGKTKTPTNSEGNLFTRQNSLTLSKDEVKEKLAEMGIDGQRITRDKKSSVRTPVWSGPPQMSLSTQMKQPFEHICAAVRHSIHNISVVGNDQMLDSYCVGIMSDYLILNTHTLTAIKDKHTIVVSIQDGERLRSVQTVSYRADYVCDIGNDISIMRIPGLSCKDLRPWMPVEHPSSYFNGQFTLGSLLSRREENIVNVSTHFNPSPLTTSTGVKHKNTLTYDFPGHESGDCGRPLVIRRGAGVQFVGLHCAGASDSAYSVTTTFLRSDIDKGLTALQNMPSCLEPLASEGDIPRYVEDGVEMTFGLPNRTSFLNYQSGYVKFEGTIVNYKSNQPRAKIVHLATANAMIDSSFEVLLPNGDYKWGKPDFFEHNNPDGTFSSPYHSFADKAFQGGSFMDESFIELALDSLKSRYDNSTVVWDATPLDMYSVVNGDNLVSSLHKINPATSMGFGYIGKKSEYLMDDVSEQAPDGRMFNDEILNDYLEVMTVYATGVTARPINKASLKGEARANTMDCDGNTVTKAARVFCATSITDVMVGRTVLQPLFNLMNRKENRSTFECCVGINAASDDWGVLRERFGDVLKTSFGSDISGYDTKMPKLIKMAAMTMLINIARRCNYSEESITVLRGYLTDCIFPLVLVKADLITLPNLNVSGRVGTAEFNSLCLSIIFRCSYYMCQKDVGGGIIAKSFEKNIELFTYGDDSKCGSRVDWFDQYTFTGSCMYFGIEVTTADKSAIKSSYTDFDTDEFLHREWRFDDEYKVWCAPLAMESIARSLVINNASDLGIDLQSLEASKSANWEFAQHGREVFDFKMTELIQIFKKSGVTERVGPAPYKTFDEIMTANYGLPHNGEEVTNL